MSVSMYQTTAPLLLRGLRNLEAMLDKAKVFAAGRQIDETVLLHYRLAPDMYPLVRQVQIACDQATRAMARLTGDELPSFADTEQSFDQLGSRVQRAIACVASYRPDQLDGSEVRAVEVQTRTRQLQFSGLDFAAQFALPNFYFHATMAYAILRHCGVELGKADFLGEFRPTM